MNLITHTDLIKRAEKWLRNPRSGNVHMARSGCGVVLCEYHCLLPEVPDVIGFNSKYSFVIECKISRADLLADKNKQHRNSPDSFGNYRYYLTLPHIACDADIPADWGLLYAFDKRIIEVKPAIEHTQTQTRQAEWSMLYSIIRRCELRGYLKDIQNPLPTIKEVQGVNNRTTAES